MLKRFKPFLLFLVPLVLACVYAGLTYNSLNNQELSNMDRELTQLSIQQAQNFQAWSGVFSRFGFRHIGPVHFYYLALVDKVLDFIPNIHARARWGTLFFNTCTLSLALLILANYFRLSSLLIFLATFLVVTSKWVGLYFADYWNPNFIPTLTVLYIALLLAWLEEATLYKRENRDCNPKKLCLLATCATLVAQVMIQIHIGVGITVAGLYLFAFFKSWYVLRSKIGLKETWPYLLIVVSLSCVLWLPVIYEALVFENFGNLGRLFSFFQQAGDKTPIQRAGSNFIKYLATSAFIENNQSYRTITVAIYILGIIAAFQLLLSKSSTLANKNLASIFLVFSALIFISLTQIKGVFSLYMLAMGYLLLPLAMLVLSVLGCVYLRSKKFSWFHALGCICCLGLVIYFYPVQQFSKRSAKIKTRVENIIRKVNFKAGYIYHISLANPAPYRFVSRFILEATLQGKSICVDKEWGYRFGDALRCDYLKEGDKNGDFEKKVIDVEFFYATDGSIDIRL